jgi:hypothetical protein
MDSGHDDTVTLWRPTGIGLWPNAVRALEAIPAALSRYDAVRRARTRMIMMRWSRSIAWLAHLQGPGRCALRDHLAASAAPLTLDHGMDKLLAWHPRERP